MRILGISLIAWAGICILLAMLWVFVWPSERATDAKGARYLILRWAHSLTWLLLALSALAAGSEESAIVFLAKPIALLALGVYGAFFVTMVISRSGR